MEKCLHCLWWHNYTGEYAKGRYEDTLSPCVSDGYPATTHPTAAVRRKLPIGARTPPEQRPPTSPPRPRRTRGTAARPAAGGPNIPAARLARPVNCPSSVLARTRVHFFGSISCPIDASTAAADTHPVHRINCAIRADSTPSRLPGVWRCHHGLSLSDLTHDATENRSAGHKQRWQ